MNEKLTPVRFVKKIVRYGDMLSGEPHFYEKVLQYCTIDAATGEVTWHDVPTITE